jgi:hypothetical protein
LIEKANSSGLPVLVIDLLLALFGPHQENVSRKKNYDVPMLLVREKKSKTKQFHPTNNHVPTILLIISISV